MDDTVPLQDAMDDEVLWAIMEEESKEKEKRYKEYCSLISTINELFETLRSIKDDPERRATIVDHRNDLIFEANRLKERYNF